MTGVSESVSPRLVTARGPVTCHVTGEGGVTAAMRQHGGARCGVYGVVWCYISAEHTGVMGVQSVQDCRTMYCSETANRDICSWMLRHKVLIEIVPLKLSDIALT